MNFAIEPYVGPLPIRFEMRPPEVTRLIGPPLVTRTAWHGGIEEYRPTLNLGYSKVDGHIFEAVFLPEAPLFYRGQDLYQHNNPISFLRTFDDSPFEWVGMVLFHKLGIRFTGFHDNDESQKAIGVVRKGYWDEYLKDFVPYE